VDNAGALLAADAGEGCAMRQERMDERMARVAGGGMDHEARRLVEDQQIGVLEEDIERDFLGLEQGGFGGGFRDGHEGVVSDFVAGFGGLSGESNVALLDEGLQPGAGDVGQLSSQETVQPIPRGACIDSELRHLPE
jgi:hypothetical protein